MAAMLHVGARCAKNFYLAIRAGEFVGYEEIRRPGKRVRYKFLRAHFRRVDAVTVMEPNQRLRLVLAAEAEARLPVAEWPNRFSKSFRKAG